MHIRSFKIIQRYCFSILIGILIVMGMIFGANAQPANKAISSVSVPPVYLRSPNDAKEVTKQLKTSRYALLSADQLNRVAFYLNKKPRKLAHEVMWFYSQEDLKNIAGLESVADLSARLNNLILQEPKTSAYQQIEIENTATSVR